MNRQMPENRIGAAFQTNQIEPTAERITSNTDRAFTGIEKASARLDALVSELERRISPVLLAAPPQDEGKGQQRGTTSQLADKLFAEETLLCGLAERLDSVISRIDL